MPQASTVPQLHEFVAAHLPKVFVAIETHVDQAIESLPSAGIDYSNLWRSIGGQFAGGKRLRPSLTLAAYGGFGGDDPDAVVPVAAATEMLHVSMLIHDDIIDHDEVRRGKPNVAGMRRAEVVGSALSPGPLEGQISISVTPSGVKPAISDSSSNAANSAFELRVTNMRMI